MRRDAWLLGLLFLPDLLDLAASRSPREFWWLLGRKVRDLLIALELVVAICMFFGLTGIGKPTIPNIIPPPPGGCPPAVMTAAATFGMGTLEGADLGWLEEHSITPPPTTALANGAYEGCP